jgi:hypothetical protein
MANNSTNVKKPNKCLPIYTIEHKNRSSLETGTKVLKGIKKVTGTSCIYMYIVYGKSHRIETQVENASEILTGFPYCYIDIHQCQNKHKKRGIIPMFSYIV